MADVITGGAGGIWPWHRNWITRHLAVHGIHVDLLVSRHPAMKSYTCSVSPELPHTAAAGGQAVPDIKSGKNNLKSLSIVLRFYHQNAAILQHHSSFGNPTDVSRIAYEKAGSCCAPKAPWSAALLPEAYTEPGMDIRVPHLRRSQTKPWRIPASRGCPTIDFASSRRWIAAAWDRARLARNLRINGSKSSIYLTPVYIAAFRPDYCARDARGPRSQPLDTLSRPGLFSSGPSGLIRP